LSSDTAAPLAFSYADLVEHQLDRRARAHAPLMTEQVTDDDAREGGLLFGEAREDRVVTVPETSDRIRQRRRTLQRPR
jgi:hypothetical protein